MQGDFYTVGKYREKGLQAFDMQKAIDENATYVLFNGSEGALINEKALKANTGDTVRMFVGNGGPNLVSSFHVIGEIFDTVYVEGSFALQNQSVQSTLIPCGGAVGVEFKVQVPGTYTILDHAIFRVHKGVAGALVVQGDPVPDIYDPVKSDEIRG
jgi:nitrite reductase (NO-forming)